MAKTHVKADYNSFEITTFKGKKFTLNKAVGSKLLEALEDEYWLGLNRGLFFGTAIGVAVVYFIKYAI